MIFCTKCGAQAKDDAKFCARCGAPIERTGDTNQNSEQYTQDHTQQNAQGYTQQDYTQQNAQGYTQQDYTQQNAQGYTQQNTQGYTQQNTQGYTQQNTQGYTQQNNQQNYQQNYYNPNAQGYKNTADSGDGYSQNDIQQNKVMAVLSYIGIFVIIPICAAPNSKFARFHANQGLILLIVEFIFGFSSRILSAVLYTISWRLGFIADIYGLLGIALAILAIIGIVNAATGNAKELPVIGGFKILK